MRSRQAIPALVISATPVLRPFSRPRASARTLNGAIVSAHSGDQSISSIRSPRAVMKTSVPAAPITQFVFRLFLLTISAAALRTGICTGTTTKAVSSLHRRVHRPVSPVRVSGENTKRRSALLNDLPVSDRDSLVTPTRRSKVAAANHVHNAQYSQAAYNLTVFWSRVGRLVHHSGGNAGAAKLIDEVGHPACPSWMRDREAALLQPRIQTIAHLSDFDAHQLAKTTHGIARIGLGCAAPWGPLWCKLEIEALSKMAGFNAQDIANVAWAFTSVGFDVPKLFDALAAHAAPMLPEFRAQHLSVVAWAFASNRHSAPRLMDAIASESHSRLHEFNGQALSNTLWAFAKMNHAAPDLFRAVEKQICTRLHELKDQELVSLALSFATMSHTPRRLFEALSAESARRLHRLDGRSLSNLAWAFAVADHAADDLFGSGSCFARRCAERKFASESGLRQLYQWELWRQERAAEWPALPPALLKRAKRSFVEAAPHPSRMQRSVAKALEALGFETRLEERTREGYSIDLMVLTRDGRSIAVEVDGPSHFLEESRTPTGATQLKRRQLRSFGHALVSLPYWEWEALHDKDPSERRRKQRQYLLTALRQRAPCQRKRAKTDVQ